MVQLFTYVTSAFTVRIFAGRERSPQIMPAMKRPQLLIVEDEQLLHLFLEEVLEDAGYSILVESTAEDALKALDADADRFAGLVT
jgi:ActR/RegA family two-component response regulator